jgi:cytochrome c556
MPRKAIFLILSLPLFITACSEPADTHPGQPVTQRRAAFKEIIKNFEPMHRLPTRGQGGDLTGTFWSRWSAGSRAGCFSLI